MTKIAKRRVSMTLNEKDGVVSKIETVQASGTIVTYMMDLLGISFLAMLVVLPILFIPVKDPQEGFWENLNYFGFYQPYVSFAYIMGSYTRLNNICHRGEAGASINDEPEFQAGWGWNCWSAFMLFASCLMMSSILGVIGWANDVNVGTSYQMLYGCPIACTTADVMFIFLLPKSERKVSVAVFLATYSAMCGIPIFAIFAPIAMKVFLPPMCAALIPVFIFPVLGYLLQSSIEPFMKGLMDKQTFDCSWMDSGVPLHLECMICISEMMLFPGNETVITLIAIVISGLCQRMYELHKLSSSIKESDQLTGIAGSGEDASYAQITTQETGEASPQVRRSQMPALGSRTRTVRLFNSTPEDKENSKARIIELTPDACFETYAKGIVQLSTISCPLLFVVLTYIITTGVNREQYYVYECLEGSSELLAVEFALIALGFQMFFLTMDLSFLFYHHTADAFLLMFQSYLRTYRGMIFLTLAFSSAVFTSCFMIKHDGIVVLEHLVRHCDLEAVRAS